MLTLHVPRKHTFKEWKAHEAEPPVLSQASTIVGSESCDVYDRDTGKLVLKFRKGAIPPSMVALAKQVYGNIDQRMKQSMTRNAAAGKVDLGKIQSLKQNVVAVHPSNRLGTQAKVELEGGKILSDTVCNPVKSYKAGFNYWRFKGGCALKTGFTKKFPEEWERSVPFFNAIGEQFEKAMPDVAGIHRHVMEGWEDYLIGTTPLSTVAINVNYESAYHVDRGDLPDGFSTLTVVELGDYDGGVYMVPEYSIGIDVREGDLVLSQSHKYWHGNTRIVPKSDGAKRISFVTYLKAGIPKANVRK